MVPGLVTRTSKKKLRRQSSTDGSIDSNHLSFDQGDGDARPSAAVLPTEESSVYRPVKRRKLGRFDSKFGPDMLTSINRTSTMFEMQTAHLLEKNELKGTEDYASLKAVVDEVSNVIMAIAPSEADSVRRDTIFGKFALD